MEQDELRAPLAAIGLCGSCRHWREQASKRGSVFHRCARADDDDSFARYPPLPVQRCSGHEPGKATGEG